MASAGLSETMGGRLGTASPTTSLELPPWLQARLPVGVVVQVRPRLRTERLAGVTLCGAADESVYACDGEQSTVSDVISGETYDFDGALVVDGSSGIEAVYMDAAFRSAVDPQGNTSGPPRLPVWSIQDAVQAVLRGLTNLVVFTYGGQCTGKTFLLSRVLQLAMEERLGRRPSRGGGSDGGAGGCESTPGVAPDAGVFAGAARSVGQLLSALGIPGGAGQWAQPDVCRPGQLFASHPARHAADGGLGAVHPGAGCPGRSRAPDVLAVDRRVALRPGRRRHRRGAVLPGADAFSSRERECTDAGDGPPPDGGVRLAAIRAAGCT
eukprot:ctg_324.g210